MYSLRRERDSAGDSGGMSTLLWQEDDEIKYEHNAQPRVGVCIRVGSIYARTMEAQDWWQTTYITEILEEEERYVKFRTGNSVYEWRVL
jgi:hypothetical protein